MICILEENAKSIYRNNYLWASGSGIKDEIGDMSPERTVKTSFFLSSVECFHVYFLQHGHLPRGKEVSS